MTHKSMRKVMAAILSAAMLFQMGDSSRDTGCRKSQISKKNQSF